MGVGLNGIILVDLECMAYSVWHIPIADKCVGVQVKL